MRLIRNNFLSAADMRSSAPTTVFRLLGTAYKQIDFRVLVAISHSLQQQQQQQLSYGARHRLIPNTCSLACLLTHRAG